MGTLFGALLRNPNQPPPNVDTFDKFNDTIHSFLVLQELQEVEGPYHFYLCSCHELQVTRACEHTVAFAVYKGKCKAPMDRNFDLIGRQPQIGRPPKPRHALVRQPGPKEKVSLKMSTWPKQGFSCGTDFFVVLYLAIKSLFRSKSFGKCLLIENIWQSADFGD